MVTLKQSYGTDFELLVPEGSLTYDEYTKTLSSVLGRDGFEKMKVEQI